ASTSPRPPRTPAAGSTAPAARTPRAWRSPRTAGGCRRSPPARSPAASRAAAASENVQGWTPEGPPLDVLASGQRLDVGRRVVRAEEEVPDLDDVALGLLDVERAVAALVLDG